MMMTAAMVLALVGGSVVTAETPSTLSPQKPGPGRGPGKPAEEKKEEPKKEGEGEAKKPEGEAKPADEKWVEKTIEKLPENDKAAQEALKKAWDSIYSPQAKGLEKLASDATMTVKADLSAMGMGIMESSQQLKMAWVKGQELELKVLEDAEAEAANPMAGMMRQQMKPQIKRFAQMMSFVIGWEKFDDKFKGFVFVTESTDEKSQVVRAWEKKGETFVSTLYTIADGDITRIFSADGDNKVEYAKKGRDKFFNKMKAKVDASRMGGGGRGGAGGGMPGGMPGGAAGPTEAAFTFDDRNKVGDFQIAQKIVTKVSFPMGTADFEFVIKNTKVNADVTQEMIDAAKDEPAPKPAETPAKEEKKPAETGGGKSAAGGGENPAPGPAPAGK